MISVSTNSGLNWAQALAHITNWVPVASSADGSTLIAAGGGQRVHSSLLARAGRYMGECHAKKQKCDQTEVHGRHQPPAGRSNLKIAEFLFAFFTEQEPEPRSDISRIKAIKKFGCRKSNQAIIAAPATHNQGDSAVAMRPPSRKPIGARLNRFKKKPV